MEIALDQIDKRILDILQANFPLVSRPYAKIGQRLGLDEEEVLRRVRIMRKNGIIRRMGANFQSRKLGYASTLCAASVPKDKLEQFVESVNALPGVTHNYLREHVYNVWFTLISPGKEAASQTLAELEEQTGIAILNLPATKMFKIRVDFPMEG